jgi:hypothetical protein
MDGQVSDLLPALTALASRTGADPDLQSGWQPRTWLARLLGRPAPAIQGASE